MISWNVVCTEVKVSNKLVLIKIYLTMFVTVKTLDVVSGENWVKHTSTWAGQASHLRAV